MLPLKATLAILGVYLEFAVWFCIGAFTWTWYSPFKKAQRLSRAGHYVTIHESIPDTLTVTIILAIAQELGCLFVLCQLITMFLDTDSIENPYQNTLLVHLLCFWSLITVVCTSIGSTLVVTSFMFLSRLTRVSRYRWEGRPTDDVDVEDGSSYFSDASSTGAVDSNSLNDYDYGTFVNSRRNHDYDDSPHGTPWAFRREWWIHPAPVESEQPERPDRSHRDEHRRVVFSVPDPLTSDPASPSSSPLPISGLQTELSDADDEIDMFEDDLIDLAAMREQFNDSIPTVLAPENRNRREEESRQV